MIAMKKAVIEVGGKQYLVHEGEAVNVELLEQQGKTVSFNPLLVINEDKINIGTPQVTSAKVTADIIDKDVKAEKVLSIRYEAKKRVHKIHGHRQHQTSLKITRIE
jgi:large subunit ribosomal protein L21